MERTKGVDLQLDFQPVNSWDLSSHLIGIWLNAVCVCVCRHGEREKEKE